MKISLHTVQSYGNTLYKPKLIPVLVGDYEWNNNGFNLHWILSNVKQSKHINSQCIHETLLFAFIPKFIVLVIFPNS